MKRVIIIGVIVVIAGLLVATYFSCDPNVSRFFPRCLFKLVTGYSCPGCGIQRALHALLHGDVVGAWHYNRFLIVSVPLMAIYGFADKFRTSHPKLYSSLNSPFLIGAIFVMTVTWWVVRNIYGI